MPKGHTGLRVLGGMDCQSIQHCEPAIDAAGNSRWIRREEDTMKPVIVRSLILTVGVLLLALTPYGEPLAQLSISPPLGCTEPSGGYCVTGGCNACTGTTCYTGVSGSLTVSVYDGLYCGDDYCPEDPCDNPETLSARGSVSMTGIGQWVDTAVVCQGIFQCANPGIGCGRCESVGLNWQDSSATLEPLECEFSWAGEYQYHIWAVDLDATECPDDCDDTDDNACNVNGDCNACSSNGYAHAASCCVTIPS